MYLREIVARNREKQIFNAWSEATTEYPPLKNVFFENDTVVGKNQPNDSYVSMALVYSNPRTVDDDIELPLYQPYGTKQKTNFYNYGRLNQRTTKGIGQ